MAVPPPEREFARLQQTLKKGLPQVVLIAGVSRFFRDEAFEAARAAVGDSVDLRVIDGEQPSDGSELDDLRGGTLFAPGAWLAVRRGDAWLKKHGDAVRAALEQLAPTCGLLLEVTKLDKRTKLGKQLAAHGMFEFRDLYAEPFDRSRSPLEAELFGWLRKRAMAMGMKLKPEAALVLVSIVGRDPAELVSALEHLADQVDRDGPPLGPEDLRGKFDSGFESTPFELAEALLDGDRRRCERSLEAMYRRGVRGREADKRIEGGGVFPFLVSWLHRTLADAYRGRCLLDSGVPMAEVPRRLGVRVFVDRFQKQVASNPAERLVRGLELLARCERELRLTGEDPAWLLRRFLSRYFAGVREAAS